MSDDLVLRLVEARDEALAAERARVDANARARDAAARAAQLERELEQRDMLRLEAELGPSRRAPINVEASTDDELAAARDAGHAV